MADKEPKREIEYVDIVNEKDEPIGKEEIDKTIRKNLLRRVVHVFIFNDEGNLLIQLRSRNMPISPLKYSSSAAGHVTSGETYDKAAERETFEEIGTKTKLKFIKKFRHKSDTADTFVELFVGKSNGPFKFDKGEIEHAMFYHVNDVKALLRTKPDSFTSTFKECFKIYLAAEAKEE